MPSAEDTTGWDPGARGRGVALSIHPVTGVGAVVPGADLAELLAEVLLPADREHSPVPGGLIDGDVLVVTQKVVSKAEGRLVTLDPDDHEARTALIESESVRIVRRRGDLLITETRHGFVCANAGVDLSNVDEGTAALLPLDPDRSARRIREAFSHRHRVTVGVIISDTFGRTWRRGVTDIAIGLAGVIGVLDLRGTVDANGRTLEATEVCVADQLAGAAELVMGKAQGIPAAVVRGVDPTWLRAGSVRSDIVRPPSEDLFR